MHKLASREVAALDPYKFMALIAALPRDEFDTVDDWVHIYESVGISELETGFVHSLAIMGRVATRPARVRKMVWLMPRMAKAVLHLGYILVAGRKPAASR